MNATHYKTAYDSLFNTMPRWKQLAIKEDSERSNWSGILTDFVKSVIEIAEKNFDTSIAGKKSTESIAASKPVKEKTKVKSKSKKVKKKQS